MVLKKIRRLEIESELVGLGIFMIISAAYIMVKFDSEKLLDTLFLWMFPASVMVFLTLLIIFFIERFYRK